MYYQEEKWLGTTRWHNLHTIAKGTTSLQRIEGKGHSIATVTCSHGWPMNQCQHSSQEVAEAAESGLSWLAQNPIGTAAEQEQKLHLPSICFNLSSTGPKKTSECHFLKHTHNAMQKKACSGLLSHCWGWCTRTLWVSVKPLLLQVQLHSKWKAWSPCQYICSLAAPRFVAANLRFSWMIVFSNTSDHLFLPPPLPLLPSPLLLLNSVLSDQDILEAKAD